MTNNENFRGIENFYRKSAPNFLEWSPDLKKIGLYAMHIGYQNWHEPVSNATSVVQMSQKIIELSEIKPGQTILDAGCGVGNLSFKINEIEPKVKVFGIDLTKNHIYLANQHVEHEKFSYPQFSIQDYEQTACHSGAFDRIIFCESFIHSQGKKNLIQESNRILKPSGKIIIADIFMHTDLLTKEETDIMDGLMTNMYIPRITHIKELIALLSTSDFSDINPRNITENVIAPTDYYLPYEQKSNTDNQAQDMEILLAGLQKLMREGKAGYYILTAQKV